jgi:hypothetical protein
MCGIPSKWATVDVSWGEGKKHLCARDAESFEFHADEEVAQNAAEKSIRQGGGMVAIMEIKRVLVAKPIVYEILSSGGYINQVEEDQQS